MKSVSTTKPLAIVDVETTGGSPLRDRIIDIGIIRIEEGKIVETFQSLIDPEQYIPPQILSLTGISERELEKAPTFHDISDIITELLSGCIFVAHNARFDYAFLKGEFDRLSLPFSAKRLCTVALSRSLFPEYKRHDLSTIIDRFDLSCSDRHRALPDAEVLVQFLQHSEKLVGEELFLEKVQAVIDRARIPTGIDKKLISALPETPGVYKFFGEDGELLYIGKSINIKKRVQSHFTNDYATRKAMRLAEEVRDIEYIQTHGELGALLLESRLIKQEQPLYNRMSRRMKKLVIVTEELRDGYKHAVCSTLDTDAMQFSKSILGIFKSPSQAKKVLDEYSQAFSLCPRMLGLEQGKGQCFYAQLGRCHGACTGKEDAEVYNKRFHEAFKTRRIKAWPFRGPIVIEEKNIQRERGQAFIIDEWRLVGSFTYDESGSAPFLPEQYVFDYDGYKILAGFIVKNRKKIKELTKSQYNELLRVQDTV
jgi:DNA polymerase-3 subunit epsilon